MNVSAREGGGGGRNLQGHLVITVGYVGDKEGGAEGRNLQSRPVLDATSDLSIAFMASVQASDVSCKEMG